MSPDFSSYEYVAIVVPGAALLLGAILLFPERWESLEKQFVSLGGLGLFIIAAFVVGQVLHEGSGWITDHVRRQWCGELPTQKLLDAEQRIISGAQRMRLHALVAERFRFSVIRAAAVDAANHSWWELEAESEEQLEALFAGWREAARRRKAEWFLIGREIYVLARHAGRTERIDTFLRNYTLCRSLTLVAALLALLSLYRALTATRVARWPFFVATPLLAGAAWVLYQRMLDSGEYYARELVLVYLNLPGG
jgi:hypothetical protein